VILNVEEGDSVEVTAESLNVTTDVQHDFKVESAPRHGDIFLVDTPAERFTSEDLKKEDVLYVHDGDEIGKNRLYDHFSLRVDGGEVVDVEVEVSPVDDFPPALQIKASPTVEEGGRVVLTTAHFAVYDKDTEDDSISCRMIAQPMFGAVERKGDGKVDTFTYGELVRGEISYRQSVHQGLEPREDGFSLLCTDPPNNTEDSAANFGLVPLTLLDRDDESPQLTARLITVLPHTQTPLIPDLVDVEDLDTPLRDIVFRVKAHPILGKIVNGNGRELEELDYTELEGAVYSSGGSQGEDNFILSAFDGGRESTAEVRVEVRGKEGPIPRVIVNEGLEVRIGQSGVIGRHNLRAECGHLPPSRVMYIVNSLPLFGSLSLDSRPVELGRSFSQAEIDAGLLCYSHSDSTGSMDVFVFDLIAGAATLHDQNFFITVKNGDSTYPTVTSRTAHVEAGGSLILDDDVISAAGPDSEMEYHVMSVPKWGRLERVDAPGQPVLVFSQQDVLAGVIRYIQRGPPSLDSPEIIQLEVTDGRRSVFHSLSIRVIPPSASLLRDDSPPSVVLETNRPLSFIQSLPGGLLGSSISPAHLAASPSPLTYLLTTPPSHGYLYNSLFGHAVTNFTQGKNTSLTLTLFILNWFVPIRYFR
jgi:hypothetical protein